MITQGKNKIKELAIRKEMPLKELAINSQVSCSELIRIINGKSFPVFETMILIGECQRIYDYLSELYFSWHSSRLSIKDCTAFLCPNVSLLYIFIGILISFIFSQIGM